MSYVKTTWETGDTVTAAKLNNMESGIEASGAWGDITDKPFNKIGDGFSISAAGDLNVNVPLYIRITQPPNKTKYMAGERFDKTGMIVMVAFLDRPNVYHEVVNYFVEPQSPLTVDDGEVIIVYEFGEVRLSATLEITVVDKWTKSKIGDVITGATLLEDGDSINVGNGITVPEYDDSCEYEFGDSEDGGNDLRWIKVDTDKFICDRNILTAISWDDLYYMGFVDGTDFEIDGHTFTVRLLTGGEYPYDEESGRGGTDDDENENEWDMFISGFEETEGYAIPLGNENSIWHWVDIYSWCSEVDGYEEGCATARGCYKVDSFYSCETSYRDEGGFRSERVGFRPMLIRNDEEE